MVRAVFVLAAIAVLTLVLIPFQWLSVRLKLPTRRSIPVFYHGIVHSLLGVRIKVIGERMREHPLLIVSNHVSWLDISVITALAPVVFVAKREVASWPLFGLLAKLQRSVFVDRSRRHKTREVNSEIAQRLAEGDPVVLFGEGTSSDGNRVLPFRTALIGAARDALAEAEHARARLDSAFVDRLYKASGPAPRPSTSPAGRLVWRNPALAPSPWHRPARRHRRRRHLGRSHLLRRSFRSQDGGAGVGDDGAPAHDRGHARTAGEASGTATAIARIPFCGQIR